MSGLLKKRGNIITGGEAMNLDVQQIEILILESTLRSSIEYEQRCLRRLHKAQDDYSEASVAVIKQANELEEKRRQYLRRAV